MLDKVLNKAEVNSTADALHLIKKSVTTPKQISSFTHNFYKYPACFPETFPRSVLRTFSKKNDWILDPFVGGGTTAVEALAAKRNFIGSDINDLAVFSSTFKTTLLDPLDILEIDNIFKSLKYKRTVKISEEDLLYFKNVPKGIGAFVILVKVKINLLSRARARMFCTGVLLRFAQLELERDYVLLNAVLEDRFFKLLEKLIEKNLQFRSLTTNFESSIKPTLRILKSDASDPLTIEQYYKITNREFNLVVTSPPYPQRHILYNKWQVDGRAETNLPYWIIDSHDVFSEEHYTMGGRISETSLDVYLSQIHSVYSNINHMLIMGGLVIQVVAFNDLKSQFFGFLDAMNEAGFEEIKKVDRSSYDGRLWRNVPFTKWYNRNKGKIAACKEVVLFHKKKRNL